MIQSPQHSEGRLPLVLVVDDNPAIRDMVSWALELDGYEPVEASEGQEALDWIRNAAREGRYPSVILLDLAMPGMDGLAFLTQLRSGWQTLYNAYPQPSIVVITAGSLAEDATSLSVAQVISKPFHVRDLLDIVRELTHL
jgi:two-component system chemotaxis response regulator CheY